MIKIDIEKWGKIEGLSITLNLGITVALINYCLNNDNSIFVEFLKNLFN